MEELNNKLNSGNPVIVSQIISKLIEIVKNKQSNDILEVPEVKFLKEKCFTNNNAISAVTSEAILQIVRNSNPAEAKNMITDLVTVITTTKCSYPNIPFLINNLLLIDMQNEISQNNCYKCSFNLRLPQHPLILLLTEDPYSWTLVYKEITYSYSSTNENVHSNCQELYKPVFLYALCNPHESSLNSFKQKLWTFIIQNESTIILNCLLPWMQFERRETVHINAECRNTIQVNSDLLTELSESNALDQNLLLLWQAAALHQLILNNFDPRGIILSIRKIINDQEVSIISSPVLQILAKAIPLCPSIYLLQLLNLCKLIIGRRELDLITIQIIKSSLLQWIANSSSLTSEAVKVANQIFLFLEKKSKNPASVKGHTEFFKHFENVINTNSDVYIAMQLYVLLEEWKSNEDIIDWVSKLENSPTFFIIKIVDFLIGLFLTEFNNDEINSKTFELILRCIECNKTLASNILTIILYKLSNTTSPRLHYQLLKALPKMAVMRDNVQKIVGTIQALNRGRNTLKTFSTTLMFDLWKIDNKCYPYLENLLIVPYTSNSDRWEFYITRSHVLKQLCALKPELYGKEMVAHLSKVLNECNSTGGDVACALAIDGITLLCKFEIIDAVTTWATLEPMFKNENRIPVIKSICSLVSEIPNLSYTEAYPKLTEEVVAKLWEYIVLNTDNEVWEAALNALTHFSIEQIVAQMPDEFLDDETIALKKTGHMIPGQCWIHFLKSCDRRRLEVTADFLIKMVSLEISSYLKFVYLVKGTREPADYSYLPINSVVRGISTYIKSKMYKWKGNVHKEVYLECLRIFSQEYSKPLPPLDWCFLQELVHEPEAKKFCINIAAHQVVLSGTARRFIVNYIEAVIENHTNEDDVLNIYGNLKHLANSVQPFTLKPFLEITICSAVESFKNGNDEPFLTIVKHLNATLKDETIQESNKTVIAEIISGIVDEADINSKLFEVLLESVILFPKKCLDDISSPKSVKEVRAEWLKKAIRIRCHLSINSKDARLNYLNELIEVGGSFPGVTTFMYEQFALVFQIHRDNTECVLWVLELIGQIQAVIAEKVEEREILFLCNIFILATVVFSGHFVLLQDFSNCKKMYKLFPRAIATLLEINHWSICTTQALEWFYHMKMNTEKMFNDEFREMFVQCLQSLRNDDEFHKYMKWTKYLNVAC